MSGYNAEYTAPRDEETPEPIVLPETVTPMAPWNVPTELNLYGSTFEPMLKEDADKLIAEGTVDVAQLMATMRQLLWASRQTIQADDYRIAHIWEQAGEIADQKGYCDVFDTFMDDLGTGYAREEEVVAWVDVTVKIPVPITMRRDGDVMDYLDNSTIDDAFSMASIDITSDSWELDWVEKN